MAVEVPMVMTINIPIHTSSHRKIFLGKRKLKKSVVVDESDCDTANEDSADDRDDHVDEDIDELDIDNDSSSNELMDDPDEPIKIKQAKFGQRAHSGLSIW